MSYDNYKLSNGIDEQEESDFDNWVQNTDVTELTEAVKYPLNELCNENRIAQDDDDGIRDYLLNWHRAELEEHFNDN